MFTSTLQYDDLWVVIALVSITPAVSNGLLTVDPVSELRAHHLRPRLSVGTWSRIAFDNLGAVGC